MDVYLNIMWSIFKVALFICLLFLVLGFIAFLIRRARGEKIDMGLGESIKNKLPGRHKVERFDDDFEDFLEDD